MKRKFHGSIFHMQRDIIQAPKADCFGAGLRRGGLEAHVPRLADVAKRDVQTCRLDERSATCA
jgi:hypothetical protein